MTQYKVDGMTCGGCATSITRALKAAQPSAQVDVDLDAGAVRVEGMAEQEVRRVVEEAGFDFVGVL